MRSIKPSPALPQIPNAIEAIRKRMFISPSAFAVRVGVSTVLLRKFESGRSHPALNVLDEIVCLALQFGLHSSDEMQALNLYCKARMRKEIMHGVLFLLAKTRGGYLDASDLALLLNCWLLNRWSREPYSPSGEPASLWNSRFQQIEFLKRLIELRDRGYLSFADIALRENAVPLACVGRINLTPRAFSARNDDFLVGNSFTAFLKEIARKEREKLARVGLCYLGEHRAA